MYQLQIFSPIQQLSFRFVVQKLFSLMYSWRVHAVPQGLSWLPNLLYSVSSSCLLSEAVYSMLSCLAGVTVTNTHVFLIMLMGGGRFSILLPCHLRPPILTFLLSKLLIKHATNKIQISHNNDINLYYAFYILFLQ